VRTARDRILLAAADLLQSGGRDAATTRAVSIAAGVTEPTIYRLFGDKSGLLDAVAEHGFASYLGRKSARSSNGDPIDDLRTGWDQHVGFGLANPELYLLMYGDPRRAATSPASASAACVLRALIGRIAAAGRLTVGEERATQLVQAVGSGVTFTLIGQSADQRDPELSIIAREALLAAITTDAPPRTEPGPVAAAVALRSGLSDTCVLTPPESALMTEWLDRIAAGPKTPR
jgi:AcrR family transcriptional regulator